MGIIDHLGSTSWDCGREERRRERERKRGRGREEKEREREGRERGKREKEKEERALGQEEMTLRNRPSTNVLKITAQEQYSTKFIHRLVNRRLYLNMDEMCMEYN